MLVNTGQHSPSRSGSAPLSPPVNSLCPLSSNLQDGQLSLSELTDKMDFIKSSTITDYGGMRVDEHDEL